MPPPHDGNEYLPFVDLIRLKKIDDAIYQSIALPFSPGGQHPDAVPRSYGGHVYAQSAWAACQTVAQGFLLYVLTWRKHSSDAYAQNVVGHFLLPGSRTDTYLYKIETIRDGRSYATRQVSVTQVGQSAIFFTCTCSFKKPESGLLDVQAEVDLWDKYKSVLDESRPGDHEEVPGVDIPWYWKLKEETGINDAFPGLQSTKVDMEGYNKDRHPLDRRSLMFYRTLGKLPSDPNMHLCAHLYASDRNSLYIVTNHLDVGDLYTQMSSLVHITSFHTSMDELTFGPSTIQQSPMDDTSEQGRWFCKEDYTTRAANGRAIFHSRVWASHGAHVATLMQDGMIRFTKKPKATKEETALMQARQAKWKSREKL